MIEPVNLVVITDPGRDIDDEYTLVLMAALARQGFVRPLAVVANLAPARLRARLARGTLDAVGLGAVPVGIGTDCKKSADIAERAEWDVPYLAAETSLTDGQSLLQRTLEEAAEKSVTLLLISGLTDAMQLMQRYPKLFRTKVREVVIMGGVKVLDPGYMTPDDAANNTFDRFAGNYVYWETQGLGIPLTIVTRHAAYASRIPIGMLEPLRAIDRPIAVRLVDAPLTRLETLWRRAHLSPGHPERNGLPDHCTKEWFAETYCGGRGSSRHGNDPIRDLVEWINLYDPIALIAAIPQFRTVFFDSELVVVNGVTHHVIGVSKEQHGIRNADVLRTTIMGGVEAALRG